VWDATTFTKNRERLQQGEGVHSFHGETVT
jgi:hypothetical protein